MVNIMLKFNSAECTIYHLFSRVYNTFDSRGDKFSVNIDNTYINLKKLGIYINKMFL